MIEHYYVPGESEDRPYKSQCACGLWFYDILAHTDCANMGCHPEQYHDRRVNPMFRAPRNWTEG